MKTFGWMYTGLALLLTLGCLSADGEEQYKTVTLTPSESGKVVTLARGDVLVVKLSGTAGTGYSWKVAKNKEEVLTPVGEPEGESNEKDQQICGGRETWSFRFKAAAVGTSELEVLYQRSWEKDKSPARTFRATVRVK